MDAQRAIFGIATMAAVLGAGCGTSPPTEFHVLGSDAREPVAAVPDQASVGVGPVALPGYLDRPQMVTRPSDTDLELAEFHHWAEPLRDNVARVLGDNLARLLGSDRVYAFPWELRRAPDYRVAIDISRFEATAGAAVLIARWTVVYGPDDQVVAVRRSELEAPVDASSYAAIARGLSTALGDLSREIAQAIATAQAGGG